MRRAAMILVAALLIGGIAYAQETPARRRRIPPTRSRSRGRSRRPSCGPMRTFLSTASSIRGRRSSSSAMWKTRGARTTVGRAAERGGPYQVAEEDQKKFEEVVGDAFLKELSRSKQFEVVDEVGPDTLLVRAMVVGYCVRRAWELCRDRRRLYGVARRGDFCLRAHRRGDRCRTGHDRRTPTDSPPPARAMGGVGSAQMNQATVWNDIKIWATSVARELKTKPSTRPRKRPARNK